MESNIVVPEIGESIIDATLAHWLKQPGDKVTAGEAVAELETDKVVLEVSAAISGVLVSVNHLEGEDVHVGDVLGVISESAAKPKPKPETESKPELESKPQTRLSAEATTPEEPTLEEKVTPLARRIAEENGIDLSSIQGSGPGGRVGKGDVEKKMTETASPLVKPVPAPEPKLKVETAASNPAEERIRMSRRRRTIAQRLLEAQHSTAMLTTFNDVDMTAVMEIRQKHKQAFKDKYGASLGIVSFFVKASVQALKEFPNVNAEILEDEIVLKRHYDIGIAIGAEEGLVVPVLRGANHMSFAEIEKGIQAFVQKSQAGALTLEDLRGGTFTITNGGIFGSLLSTPILNYPQVAILGLHRIEERPAAVNHQVVLRQMMYVAVSYDHRIVDGREAVQFLARIKQSIEEPEALLLEI